MLMTGLGALTGALSNTNANKTSTYSGQQAQSNSGTTTTGRNLTPYQSAIQAPLFDYVSNLMTNPQATVAPFQTAARNNVNSNYKGLADSLRQQFLSTGGGGSGKFGTALAQGNLNRLSDLSNVDNTMAQTAATLPLQGANLASGLLGMNFGSTTSTSSTGSSSSSGQQVGAGSPLAGAFQGGTSSLAQMLMAAMLGGM